MSIPPPLSRTARRRVLLSSGCAALMLAASCGDGGTGPTPMPDPQNPVPSISSLDPAAVLQYSDSVTVTITGSGFVSGAVVRLNGTARLTAYTSPSQLTAVVPVTAMQEAVQLQVTVFNPAPGGGESAAVPLPVQHRVPTIAALSPGGSMQGDSAFVLEVAGTGFARASVIQWNGVDRPTTFVDPYHLTTPIAAAELDSVGAAQVTVFNPAPGGGASAPRVFTVSARPNPVPHLTELSPSTLVAGTGGTVTVTGTGFVTGTQVFAGGFSPTTTVVSSTEVRFTLQGSNLPNPGAAPIYVRNPEPGGGNSNSLQLTVNSPVPTLTALSPAEATVREDSLPVRLTGAGFMVNSFVLVNNQPRTSRRISATEMEVVLFSYEVSRPGTLSFRVSTSQPGGGVSAPLTLSIVNPAPVVQSLSPAQSEAGQDSLMVRVTGTGFLPSSVARVGGSARTTRYVSATALDMVLGPEDLDEAGTFAITVFTPQPGGGISAAVNLTLTAPAPVLESLPSYGASAGRPGFTLVVNGSGFLRNSVVRWNGVDRATQYVGSTRLAIELSSADLGSPGTGSITVHTPGGGTTAARQMTIRALGPATITSRRVVPFPAGDVVYDPHSRRLYASLVAGAGVRANTVVAIDPTTGEITASVGVGSDPGRLALSDDGSTLWVALNGSGEVRRLSLPDLSPGASFSLGNDRVEDMRVMPGRPGTVAITIRNTCCSPRHEAVAIFDGGVRRARVTREHSGNNTITFGESANVLYGYNTESSEAGFRTMRVSGEGVEVTRITERIYLGNSLQYAGGRVYSAAPTVVDAGRHVSVGSFPSWGPFVTVDATLGRIFYVDTFDQLLRVHDINTFQELSSVALDDFNRNHPVAALDRMVRWGTDGLAVSDAKQIYIYRSPIAGP